MQEQKFNLCQKVEYKVTAKVGDVKVSQLKPFYVTGVRVEPTSTGVLFLYSIAEELPAAYYNGKGFIHNVPEEELI